MLFSVVETKNPPEGRGWAKLLAWPVQPGLMGHPALTRGCRAMQQSKNHIPMRSEAH